MTDWRAWLRRKLFSEPPDTRHSRKDPSIDFPEIVNDTEDSRSVEAPTISSDDVTPATIADATHPDDLYWPDESAFVDPVSPAMPRANAALSFVDEDKMHPDDAYWPDHEPIQLPDASPSETFDYSRSDDDLASKTSDASTREDAQKVERDVSSGFDLTTLDDEDEGVQDNLFALVFDELDAFEGEETMIPPPMAQNVESYVDGSDDDLLFDALVGSHPGDTPDQNALDDTDWAYDLDDLAEVDFDVDPTNGWEAIETPPWRVKERAAVLVHMMPLCTELERKAAFDVLCALLEEFSHGASHMAVARQVEAGATLDTLLQCAAIKRLWNEDSGLWLRRRHVIGIESAPSCRSAMTWALAGRLLDAYGHEAMGDAILGDWRDAWMTMELPRIGEPAPNEWWSYAAYLDHLALHAENDHLIEASGRYADLETGWAYTSLASRADFRDRLGQESWIVEETGALLSQIAKPTSNSAEVR